MTIARNQVIVRTQVVVRTQEELRIAIGNIQSVGFVPTMGALHAGHSSLLAKARAENELVVLSIFVNPTQFGEDEDFDSYPSTFEVDRAKAEKEGVNIIFAPTLDVIYPEGFETTVDVAEVAKPLCGSRRPGHFTGVATVVARLFGLIRPARAYLGLKDLQQCMVLQRMVLDLALPVKLIFCPTIREVDGLAMSSRNQCLSESEREIAPEIYRSLKLVLTRFLEGERAVAKLEKLGRESLGQSGNFSIEYLEVRSIPNLSKISLVPEEKDHLVNAYAVCAVAVRLGETRLIDNILLSM